MTKCNPHRIKKTPNSTLFQCPYDKACMCGMSDCCKGCETHSAWFYPQEKSCEGCEYNRDSYVCLHCIHYPSDSPYVKDNFTPKKGE